MSQTMTRELLAKMLASIEELERSEDRFTVPEGRKLELIQRGGSGAGSPVPRVREVQLQDGYLSIVTEDGTWLLPYEGVGGVKISERSSAAAPKTGFHR